MEEGEQTLSQYVDALKLLSVKVCRCNDNIVVSGSGAIKVSLELEYASEDDDEEEFRTLPPDLMTLVIKECTP